jgi:phage gp36-like protein
MSTFLTKDDYKGWLSTDLLDQITGGDDTALDNPELMAEQRIKDATLAKYNTDAEFAKSGSSRNRTLLRWMLSIACYFIYHDIADDDIPARVIKDYDDCVAELEKVAAGKLSVDFDRLTETDGTTTTLFKYGSDTARSHSPY